jgi:hypothetical protein
MKSMTWLIIVFCAFSLSGCDQFRQAMRVFNKKAVAKVREARAISEAGNDADALLAEVILKPKQQKLSIKSDPFQPLYAQGLFSDQEHPDATANGAVLMNGLVYNGMVKAGEVASVLLQTPKGNVVRVLNDQVQGLTITGIDPEFITFSKDGKTFQLKRGTP